MTFGLQRRCFPWALVAWLLVVVAAPAVSAAKTVGSPAETAGSSAEEGSGFRWQGVDRVVAFADVHGAYDTLLRLLQASGVVDGEARWVGGATHLVSLGDLLDRGADSRRVMDLLMRLEGEALAAGGRVHLVLGNHEVMNLTGDLRYVAEGEFAAFADGESSDVPAGFTAHRQAFSLSGLYGRWLVGKPALIVVNDTAFVHGGLPAWAPERGIVTLNAEIQASLRALLGAGVEARAQGIVGADEDLLEAGVRLAADPRGADWPVADLVRIAASPLLGESGPLWYRGTAQCHALIEGDRLERALAALGVRRVVLGHTPTPSRRVASRFDGQVVLLDTGMLQPVYGGRGSALVVENGVDRVVVAGEAGFLPIEPLDEVQHEVAGGRDGEGTPGRETAARLIDRLLGLGLVASAVPLMEVATDEGSEASRWLSERQRVEQGLFRPNPCEVGSDYLLMYAFDALIGNPARSTDNLGYDRRTWALVLRDHGRAFGRTGLGTIAAPPQLPRRLRDRLMDLDARVLDDAVGNVLGRREIAALLDRRDAIVENWPILE